MRSGFTLEMIALPQAVDYLKQFTRKPLVRVVIQPDVPIPSYTPFIEAIAPYCTVVCCCVDSSRVGTLSEEAYVAVFEACKDEFSSYLGDDDWIWEVGNEVGGGSDDPSHLTKALLALEWSKGVPGKKLLTGYAVDGYEDYLTAIPEKQRMLLDYLLMSDYPLDGMFSPSQISWPALQLLFLHATLGIGECGI